MARVTGKRGGGTRDCRGLSSGGSIAEAATAAAAAARLLPMMMQRMPVEEARFTMHSMKSCRRAEIRRERRSSEGDAEKSSSILVAARKECQCCTGLCAATCGERICIVQSRFRFSSCPS